MKKNETEKYKKKKKEIGIRLEQLRTDNNLSQLSSMTLGERLCWLRKDNNLTRTDLQKHFGFEKYDTYANYELDKVKRIDISFIKDIAEFYNKSIDYIVYGTDTRNNDISQNSIETNFSYIYNNASDSKKEFLEKAILFIHQKFPN